MSSFRKLINSDMSHMTHDKVMFRFLCKKFIFMKKHGFAVRLKDEI